MQTNQQLQESKELQLQPYIHKWIINYSFLNTYRRVFTNTFNERMMHFQVDVSICDASVVTSVLDVFACPCVTEWVGCWGVYLSQKLCWFLIKSFHVHSSVHVQLQHVCEWENTRPLIKHPYTSPTINISWKGALPPAFIFKTSKGYYCLNFAVSEIINVSQL